MSRTYHIPLINQRKDHTNNLSAMSNDHPLHGPVFINQKRCETYEQLYEVMLNSTDGTAAQLAQTFVNTYGNSLYSGPLVTLGTADLFVNPFEESYQKDFKELNMESAISEVVKKIVGGAI